MSSPARPRTPALVLGTLATALAVVVAAVALTSRGSSPPTIAEFAPQAVQQIKKALDRQPAEQPGRGTAVPPPSPPPSSAPAGGGPSSSPTAARTVLLPRVRQCVGDPPRQTEDPQSPPCVPYFDPKLDNGGATSKGVTRDQITVAVPQQFLEDGSIPPKLATFFNNRYEFYGRKLVLTAYPPTGCANNAPDPAKMRDDAVAVDEELQAFASLAYCNAQGADHHYYDALAQRKIISVTDGNLTTGVEAHYAAHAPYEWNFQPGVETILASTAQMVCSTLAGRPPKYAGPTQSGAPVRKFGLIYTRAVDGTVPDIAPLRNGLRACGQTLFEVRDDQTSDPSRNGVNTMVSMQNAKVTSVLCVCNVLDTRQVYMPAASAQGYAPEWIESTYINNDLDNSYGGGNAPPDQAQHVLGLSFRNRLLPRQDMPWFWALREADPNANPSAGTYYSADSRYEQLLLLASGIQLAGPRLTPQTFAAGLQRARFANPGAGGAPYFQARVGFDGGRHTMTSDANLFWFDPSRPGTIDPSVPGAICYVDRGRRYGLGQWHRMDPPFFTGACS